MQMVDDRESRLRTALATIQGEDGTVRGEDIVRLVVVSWGGGIKECEGHTSRPGVPCP